MRLGNSVPLVVVALVALIQGCGDAADSEAEPESLVLGSAERFPCTMEFVDEGVALTSDREGTVPDPEPWMAWAPDAEAYLTGVQGGGAIAVWSEDGRFSRTIGRPGEGPGELGSSAIPFVDVEGNVHVFDALGGKWSRFSVAGDFLGSTTSHLLQHVSYLRATALVGASRVLIGQPSPLSPSPTQFRILDVEGSIVREFGGLPAQTRAGARAIAYAGGDSFWAAPRDGDPYVLEEWSLDGRLLRTIQRDVDWLSFPEDNGGFPRYGLSPGGGGRLVVFVVTESPQVADPVELRYEVIDPELPAVLASRQMSFADPMSGEAPPQFGLASGSSLGFRAARGELDLPIIEIMRYVLTPSPEGDPDASAVCSS